MRTQLGARCRALTLLLLLALAIAGCGGSSHRSSGALRLPLYEPIHPIDPALVSSPGAIFVASLLYSGLVKFGPDLHVIPELAVSIPTISSNGRTYTFTIRNDARFADGRTCTARDVAYSLTRALRLGGPLARRYLGGIRGAGAVIGGSAARLEGLTVIHRLTLRIGLWRPDADFLQKLAFPAASVVDPDLAAERPLRTWATAGTGPWQVDRQLPDGTLTLSPRSHFYAAPLQVRSLVLQPVGGDPAGLSLYKKNALDVARVPLDMQKSLADQPDLHSSNALDAYYAVPSGRDALPLATVLDRDRLVADTGSVLSPLSTIVPPAVPDYVSSPPSLDGSSDLARKDDVSIQLATPQDSMSQAMARALARQWTVASVGSRLTRRSDVRESITVVHASYMLPDPGAWLRIVLPRTRSRWYRASLFQANLLTNDPVTRMDTYDLSERWALEKGLIIPLASGSAVYRIKPAVQGLQVTPLGIMPDNNNWSTVEVT